MSLDPTRLTEDGEKMSYISNLVFAGRKWIDVLNAQTSRHAINECVRTGWSGRLWSSIAGPFHRSIYVRFQRSEERRVGKECRL